MSCLFAALLVSQRKKQKTKKLLLQEPIYVLGNGHLGMNQPSLRVVGCNKGWSV
jgi:hypothetical protein